MRKTEEKEKNDTEQGGGAPGGGLRPKGGTLLLLDVNAQPRALLPALVLANIVSPCDQKCMSKPVHCLCHVWCRVHLACNMSSEQALITQ